MNAKTKKAEQKVANQFYQACNSELRWGIAARA
jgi:hypothetical protein